MLYGSKSTGKTTRAFCMQEQLLHKYAVIYSTLRDGVDLSGYDQFWKSFGKCYNLPLIQSTSDFADMLKSENQDIIFKGKPVVLFIDEFEKLLGAKEEVIDSVLAILRNFKERHFNYCLHTFVGIGPYVILQLMGRYQAPFNAYRIHLSQLGLVFYSESLLFAENKNCIVIFDHCTYVFSKN